VANTKPVSAKIVNTAFRHRRTSRDGFVLVVLIRATVRSATAYGPTEGFLR